MMAADFQTAALPYILYCLYVRKSPEHEIEK